MSEWQPARWRQVHGRPWEVSNLYSDKVWEVRPTTAKPCEENLKERGCDGTNFYEVRGFPGYFMCEHEILTD